MKKYFAIAMIALAALFASSCKKDNSKTEDGPKATYRNSWVSEEMDAASALGEELLDLPADAMTQIVDKTKDLKFRRAMVFADGGKGVVGVLVNKANLLALVNAVSDWASTSTTLSDEDKETLAQVTLFLKATFSRLNDNDVLGSEFTYTAEETDATSGKLTTVMSSTDESGNPSKTTTVMDYKNLSESSITLSYAAGGVITLSSATSLGIKVGNLVDINSLMPSAE